MRAVVKLKSTPRVRIGLCVTAVRLQGTGQSVQTVVMSSRAIGHVHCRCWVVEPSWVDDAVVNWRFSFVSVSVAAEVEVDTVLVEQRFEYGSAVDADATGRHVERSVAYEMSDPDALFGQRTQGNLPKAITQGVLVRFTAARSACNHVS